MILAAALSLAACGPKTQEPSIIAPPAELGLDPFYAKYLNVKGIHLISSPVCSDEAMYAAYKTLTAMTDLLPEEVVKSMSDWGAKVVVMAKTEVTTDVPEHAFLKNDPENVPEDLAETVRTLQHHAQRRMYSALRETVTGKRTSSYTNLPMLSISSESSLYILRLMQSLRLRWMRLSLQENGSTHTPAATSMSIGPKESRAGSTSTRKDILSTEYTMRSTHAKSSRDTTRRSMKS